MKFQCAYYTDKGIRKAVNEDSLLIRVASTNRGEVMLAVVCDGMGGLNRGELASSTLVQSFSDWFDDRLPGLIENGFDPVTLRSGIEFEIRRQSKNMEEYARRNGIRMGTTITLLLVFENRCMVANVGDSRIYEVDEGICQITKDQSLVQREVETGLLTVQQAAVDPRRNILLQCVGETSNLSPAIEEKTLTSGAVYLLCSDGFCHELAPEELHSAVRSAAGKGEKVMTKTLEKLTKKAMERGETDNITVVAVTVC